MDDLQQIRQQITDIDEKMARLFEERMKACEAVAAYKKERGLPVRDPAREAAMTERYRAFIGTEAIESYYIPFLKNTIELSCRYQTRLNAGIQVAYCGVEGAFAHIAAKQMFPQSEPTAFKDFTDAYQAVESGEYDCAVLPLENSYAGEVGTVMDLIFSGELYVNRVLDLPVRHNLLVNAGATLDSVQTVISHPQALQQCSAFLRQNGLNTQEYSNTAAAAKFVKDSGDLTVAAIASEETAEIFGLEILRSDIQDVQTNHTRFAALSRVPNRAVSGSVRDDENFILVFTVKNQAGALAQTLNIIGAHGFNMRSLRSRPMKDLQWNYYFYMEAEGNIHGENGRDMLRELSAVCARLKLVGTFCSDSKH